MPEQTATRPDILSDRALRDILADIKALGEMDCQDTIALARAELHFARDMKAAAVMLEEDAMRIIRDIERREG